MHWKQSAGGGLHTRTPQDYECYRLNPNLVLQECKRERLDALEAEWRRRGAEQAAAAEVTLSAAAAAEADARKVCSGFNVSQYRVSNRLLVRYGWHIFPSCTSEAGVHKDQSRTMHRV